jgi:hypothetical protein
LRVEPVPWLEAGLRKVDRHPLASPRILGLHALPPAAKVAAAKL